MISIGWIRVAAETDTAPDIDGFLGGLAADFALIQEDHLVWVQGLPPAPDRTLVRVATLAPADFDPADAEAALHWRKNHDITVHTLAEDFAIAESIRSGLPSGANDELRFGRFEGALDRSSRIVEREIDAGTEPPAPDRDGTACPSPDHPRAPRLAKHSIGEKSSGLVPGDRVGGSHPTRRVGIEGPTPSVLTRARTILDAIAAENTEFAIVNEEVIEALAKAATKLQTDYEPQEEDTLLECMRRCYAVDRVATVLDAEGADIDAVRSLIQAQKYSIAVTSGYGHGM